MRPRRLLSGGKWRRKQRSNLRKQRALLKTLNSPTEVQHSYVYLYTYVVFDNVHMISFQQVSFQLMIDASTITYNDVYCTLHCITLLVEGNMERVCNTQGVVFMRVDKSTGDIIARLEPPDMYMYVIYIIIHICIYIVYTIAS